MAAPAIGVVFNAVDGTANAIDRINARIEAFSKKTQARVNAATAPFRRLQASIAKFGEVSGLNRVAAATRNIARAGFDAFQKLGQVVPIIGIIGGAASVAGITRMATAWADWGNRINNTSMRIGLASGRLSAFQGAARLAGGSADAMTAGLQGLGQAMYDAIGGRNPAAVTMFRTLGIGFQGVNHQARDTESTLMDVAERIKQMRGNPYAQSQVLQAFNIPTELLPVLQKGADGIRAYLAEARHYNPVTQSMVDAATRLYAAQNRVSLATEGFTNRLVERLEPVLTPLLNHFAEWIATSPEVARGIEWVGKEAEKLGAWIESGGIERFAHTVEGWITPLGNAVHWLGGDGGVAGALEGIVGIMAGGFALKVITPFLSLASAIGGVSAKLAILAATSPPAWVLAALGAGAFAVKAAWDDANKVAAATGGDAVDRSTGTDIPMFGGDLFGRRVGPDGRPSQSFGQRLLNPGGASSTTGGNPLVTPGNLAANRSLPPEARALLDTIAGPESKGDYSVLAGGGHFGNFSQFPQWSGMQHMYNGQMVTSHGAGRYQYEPGTWAAANKAAGGNLSFSPEDQDRGAWAFTQMVYKQKTGRDLLTDLHDPSRKGAIRMALSQHWGTLNMDGYERNLSREQGAPTGTPAAQGAPVTPPKAQGAPLKLETPASAAPANTGGSSNGRSTVRLEFSGLSNGVGLQHRGTEGNGPLVETPQLLGAKP